MAMRSACLRDARRDRHEPADAGRLGAADHRIELLREVRKIEMAVAVDQHVTQAFAVSISVQALAASGST